MRGGVLSKNYLLLLNELWDKIVNIVECLSISKIFREIKTGKLNANAETPNGKYAFWTCDERPKLIDEYAFDEMAILISGNGSKVGHVNIYNGKFNAYQRTYILLKINHFVLWKYAYFYLKSNLKNYINVYKLDSGIPYITLPMLQNFVIPIPHISIQNKIVEILDKLEIYTKDIQSGLPLEIDQRKKQYEYYRDKLLDFKDLAGGVLSKNYLLLLNELWDKIVNIVEYKELGTIITKAPKSPFGVAKLLKMNKGDYLAITSGNKSFYVSDFLVDGEYIFVNDGGQADVKYNQGKTMYSDHVFAFKTNECNTKYLYFYLLNISNFINEKLFVGSGLKNLNKKEFLNLNIAIPPIEIQNKIVEILDKLQAYTKDIQTGLPLEIDQRKKQYEHYRDKLLNFKEKNTKI
ncbi:restriction endonuclease subunit S [Mycoplasma hominis]|uniref:restriction endonuclease subunit S n=1 Tax=Metamycoplasma hominis TaxID=2098 RepID=UPI001746F6F3|nr:restriction endonuclease subunit S [Metamycoplasma hominis]MBD3898870.1 restriction endonuclease subunit S [Metamycoplasma hominis]